MFRSFNASLSWWRHCLVKVILSHCSYLQASGVGALSGTSAGIYGMLSRIASQHFSQLNGCTGGAWLWKIGMLFLQAVTPSVTAM
ncbi:hypothetical protein EDD18DRAFT_1165902 [Armillaria luteobubalina]|uniref:Secreted protein n=1 Tax=Armillaria luteobubalina TaxID=153913 RepID=A0AA39UP24_9AGAR|nr:hypothetical protein EDD18DRAFT_1165902 [Armillaria luteobubalina]